MFFFFFFFFHFGHLSSYDRYFEGVEASMAAVMGMTYKGSLQTHLSISMNVYSFIGITGNYLLLYLVE